MRLEDKQVVQVPFQAQIRTSQRLVRVVRAAGFLVDRSFVEEALMLLKPCLQRALKRCLAAVLQGERQSPQSLACRRFRVTCQITADGFDLVKLAQLRGNFGKHLQ